MIHCGRSGPVVVPVQAMQPINEFLPAALAAIMRKAPLSPGKIKLAWKIAVGPALDRVTTVQLAAEGVLEVKATDSHWRREIRRLTPLILRHLDNQLGTGTVAHIKVVGEPRASHRQRPQATSTPFAGHEAEPPSRPRPKTRRHSSRKTR